MDRTRRTAQHPPLDHVPSSPGSHTTRRTLLRAATLGAAGLTVPGLLSACGSDEAASAPAAGAGDLEQSSVKIFSVKDPQISAQLAYALQEGMFEDAGLEVSIDYTINGPDMASLAASGSVQVISSGVDQCATLREAGQDFSYLMKFSEISNTQGVVLGPDVTINTPKDIEGKRIGMYNGAAVALAIESMCQAEGVDYSAIEFVNLEAPEQVTALARGDIDAMAAWEPYLSSAVASGGKLWFTGNRSYLHADAGEDVDWLYLSTGLAVSQDYLKANPNTLLALMRTLAEATKRINADFEAAAEPIGKELDVPTDTLVPVLEANAYDPVVDARWLEGTKTFMAWAAQPAQGFFKETWDPLQLVDFSLFKQVDAEAVQV
ncbi:ABC transporter substrate-binding protein [Kineococcus sp. SYSU DK006]|uniref:ABC transporter substrate-binding protein n=1 Tax=Kineococcus sp. SYSU DK006 TaxID=3383127 RepID=UPI003D7DB358